jgi:hypothetical protein
MSKREIKRKRERERRTKDGRGGATSAHGQVAGEIYIYAHRASKMIMIRKGVKESMRIFQVSTSYITESREWERGREREKKMG